MTRSVESDDTTSSEFSDEINRLTERIIGAATRKPRWPPARHGPEVLRPGGVQPVTFGARDHPSSARVMVTGAGG